MEVKCIPCGGVVRSYAVGKFDHMFVESTFARGELKSGIL